MCCLNGGREGRGDENIQGGLCQLYRRSKEKAVCGAEYLQGFKWRVGAGVG